jgi:trans-aconitate methyltransferase
MAYTGRAAGYAQHRWTYAPAAIDYIAAEAGLTADSVVADIGAGTGMLSAQFMQRAGRVLAIEPDPAMRASATFAMIDARADATTLPDGSVDLVTVGRALHWFPPGTTPREFARILKSRGWLAVIRVSAAHPELTAAVQETKTEANGWNTELEAVRRRPLPLALYFGHEDYARQCFPSAVREEWPAFFGRLCSYSVSPDPSHPRFEAFEQASRTVFDRFATGGGVTIPLATEVVLGRVTVAPVP